MAATALTARARRLRRSPKTDRWWPFALALAAGAAAWTFGLRLPDSPGLLLGATVTFGAITSGFVGTSLSILTSLDAPVVRRIRKTSYIDVLRNYLGWALAAGVVLSCAGLGGLFFAPPAGWLGTAWWAALALCLGCLWRLARIMLLLFSHPDAMRDDAPPYRG